MEGLQEDIRREFEEIKEVDEDFVDFRKEPWSFFKRNRWAVLTTKRLYLVKKIFFGISFDIKQITIKDSHFEFIEGIIFDTIYIRVSSEGPLAKGGEHTLNFFPTERQSTHEFLQEIEKTREGESEGSVVAQAELEALARTFYENAISREEYEKKKAELLKKL